MISNPQTKLIKQNSNLRQLLNYFDIADKDSYLSHITIICISIFDPFLKQVFWNIFTLKKKIKKTVFIIHKELDSILSEISKVHGIYKNSRLSSPNAASFTFGKSLSMRYLSETFKWYEFGKLLVDFSRLHPVIDSDLRIPNIGSLVGCKPTTTDGLVVELVGGYLETGLPN